MNHMKREFQMFANMMVMNMMVMTAKMVIAIHLIPYIVCAKSIEACIYSVGRRPPEALKPPYTRQDLIWAPRALGSCKEPSITKYL